MNETTIPTLHHHPKKPEPQGLLGEDILKMLMNDTLAPLDLLVRESIQNSLDAASRKTESVDVLFNIEDTNPDICQLLPGLVPPTDQDLSQYQQLEVRDKGTTGLTGAARWEFNNPGNFSKLVYDIMKNQTKTDGGGSWGIGKSIFFRLGIGLVFFYSRVEDDLHPERLAVCMVENKSQLLNKHDWIPTVDTGVCWWGAQDASDKSALVGITDPELIHIILEMLDIEPFEEGETGTSIVVPFLKESSHLIGSYYDSEGTDLINQFEFEKAIELAVCRWWGVRLNNKLFPHGPYLTLHINDERFTRTSTYPIFQKIQEMYNIGCQKLNLIEAHDSDTVQKENVLLCQVVEQNAIVANKKCGVLVFARFSRDSLTERRSNRNLFFHTWHNNEYGLSDPCPVLSVYLRKPGLIINWKDDSWTNNIVDRENKDQYSVALFIPNSNASLHATMKNKLLDTGGELNTLEEYLRRTEKADHAEWNDLHNITAIHRIKKNIQSSIAKQTAGSSYTAPISSASYLSRWVGERLLPDNWGTAPSKKRKGNGNSKHPTSKKPSIHVLQTYLTEGRIIFDIQICMSKQDFTKLKVSIKTEHLASNSSSLIFERSRAFSPLVAVPSPCNSGGWASAAFSF